MHWRLGEAWLNQASSLKVELEVLLQKEFCYALFSLSYSSIGARIEILDFSGVCILKDFVYVKA